MKKKGIQNSFTLITLIILFSNTLLVAQDQRGCISGDCNNGKGIYIYKDATRYEGNFSNGMAEGQGTCYYPNGDVYTGGWKNHNFHGQGTLVFKNGERQTGTWKLGELVKENSNLNQAKSGNHLGDIASIKQGKVWAVVIGIASYQHYRSLKYTDDDAYRVYSFLKSPEGGAIPEAQITLLVDEAAKGTAILEGIKSTIQKADSNDTFLFYFSGHGIKGALLPTNYVEEDENEIKYEDIIEMVNISRAKSKIIIADVCYAGTMQNELFAYKGNIDNVIQNYYSALNASSGGIVMFLSSSANEQSIESKGMRQGIFSYYFTKGLGGNADSNGDNIITIRESFDYTRRKVQEHTNYLQNPMIIGKYDPNTPIGAVRH